MEQKYLRMLRAMEKRDAAAKRARLGRGVRSVPISDKPGPGATDPNSKIIPPAAAQGAGRGGSAVRQTERADQSDGENRDWSVYIVRCGDGSLYTGIAKDVAARVGRHNAGQGAAYTRTRMPVRLLYSEPGMTRSEALIREARIKSLPKQKKEALTAHDDGAARTTR